MNINKRLLIYYFFSFWGMYFCFFLFAWGKYHEDTKTQSIQNIALSAFVTSWQFQDKQDTPIHFTLAPVSIQQPKLRERIIGDRVEKWDSTALILHQHTNIADILERESGVFIKSYGLGSLATSAIRGGSAGHTAFIWNGFSIQSPMLGQLDLSLMPVGMLDELQLTYGGQSAVWGSGAIGGVIQMNNLPTFEQGLELTSSTGMGSFGRWNQQFKAQYASKNFSVSTRLFYQQAQNNFTYSIRPDLPKRTQSHAFLQQGGLMQEAYWKIAPNQQLGFQLWWQKTDREIPPTTTQNRSGASQTDDALRAGLHWKLTTEKLLLKARTGYFKENLLYRDELIGLNANSQFYTFISELEGQIQLNKKQQVLIGVNQTYTQAEADGYRNGREQNRVGVFAAFLQKLGKWQIQLNGRQAIIDGQFIPITPSLGIEGALTNWLQLRGKVARNYRVPTLNDLYWQPGGNAELLPEEGWSQELGVEGNWEIGNQQLSYSLTGFSRNIQNWILWSVRTGENFWSANNIASVWSRGLEQRVNWQWQHNEWDIKIGGGYDYILSTNEKALQQPRIEKGRQLIYTPIHQAFGGLRIGWRGLEMGYQHRHTSSVETQNAPLAPYQIGSAHLNASMKFPRFIFSSFFRVENIWNTSYRIIERRPMPRRNYQLGLTIQWRSKNR